MNLGPLIALPFLVLLVAVFIVMRRTRRRGLPGPGAAGAVYELLNEERRKALEIIVEERAEARDPEDKDGNLPDLQNPTSRPGEHRPPS